MKLVLWLTALFAVAVGVSLFAGISQGYAILVFPPYRVELSLNLMVVLTIATLLALYLILRAFGVALALPDRVRHYQRERKLGAARTALRQGALAFFEGRYQKAEREAVKSLDDEPLEDNRTLALLIAARASHAMKDAEKRDAYLSRLSDLGATAELARHMTDAELALDARDLAAADRAIAEARRLSPNLTAALRLELRLRLAQHAPEAVLALTEKLLKAEALQPEQARRYRQTAWQEQARHFIDPAELKRWWGRIPSQERENDTLRATVARQAHSLGDTAQAVDLLVRRLDAQYSGELAQELQPLVAALDAEARLDLMRRADVWLTQEPRDAGLLLLLGRLALAQQLWGKAQGYLEASVSLHNSLAAQVELTRLFEQLDRPDDARRHADACVQLVLAQAAGT
ncbi:heme biosynthesis HemY N-terminal domain-containing protein [Laribacter hongkongensis]|uniref:heme biosynthesis HemY N-terminal domain-containing protein n=1 Tax=Laribacter hongkongensis TaxID=168471 RepID=UPI001EFC76E6|nr:heme biosynthesis HemY N-terminal domain-containing protein [Laribacter hongkongensis]MCG8995862.1 heme biosynthesis protein HemY [Laribacter hongkongensis]MCG9010908.1 heme biosynthesis protein HemY [Laribacter hongkongensis]MCG9024011.1 heme biosynthesis protein HemY [Laribacter hongkongensis]MCG9047826.1 heme biosynthesis protein HemY [Laribacter hongkongensis]MCG9074370.1 heme biosynthesis protein HemY [Laribacter hongkongensis]